MKTNFIKTVCKAYLKNKRPPSSIDIDKVQTILIVSNTAIGDTLFATPAIRLIKNRYPEKKLVALLNPKNSELFATNPGINDYLTYNGKWSQFIQTIYKLRKYKIDVALIMSGNEPQSTPLAFFVGSKYIVKIPNKNNEFNFLHYNELVGKNLDTHTINKRLQQLNYIGIFDKSYEMELYIKEEWRQTINHIFDKGGSYIGVQMGASTVSRMWFNDQWIELVKMILEYRDDIQIVLTGSRADRKLTNELEKAVNNNRVNNLAGKFSIGAAAALIERLDLLVTPDTGPLHIAAALKVPTIAISVAGVASSSNPIDNEVAHIFIQKPKTCVPCLDKRCQYQFCMLQITPDEVFSHIMGFYE